MQKHAPKDNKMHQKQGLRNNYKIDKIVIKKGLKIFRKVNKTKKSNEKQ